MSRTSESAEARVPSSVGGPVLSHGFLGWGVAGALLLGTVASMIDAVLLLRADQSLRTVFAGGLAAGALGCLAGLALALPLALAGHLKHTARRRWTLPAWVIGAAAFFPALGVSWWLLDPLGRRLAGVYIAFALIAAGIIAVAVWLQHCRTRWLAIAGPLLIAAGGLVQDLRLPGRWYLELHDLCYFVAATGLLCAGARLQKRLSRRSLTSVATICALLLAGSLAGCWSLDVLSPGWRSRTVQHGRHARKLARYARTAIDMDRDGYSPVAWGGDCNDFSSGVHPLALDLPGGGDQNCNGVDPPIKATAAQRGLYETGSTAYLERDAVDRVVLITVDTWSAKAFTPQIMPALTALAETGTVFEYTYAATSRTEGSLPALLWADNRADSVLAQLAAESITGHAIFGWGAENSFLQNLRELLVPRSVVVPNARAVTEAGLDWLGANIGGRQFLWLHYFEPHNPTDRPDVKAPPGPSLLPAAYKLSLHEVDRELGRLFAELRSRALIERTMFIITGDHGEAFGESGFTGHSHSGFDAVLRVPAILVGPGIAPQRYRHLASARDIPATILGAFGLSQRAEAAETFGRSWIRTRTRGAPPLHRFVVARSYRYASGREVDVPLLVLIDETLAKLVVSYSDRLVELFDLRHDPNELIDIFPRERASAGRLLRKMSMYADLDQYPLPIASRTR